MIIGSIAYCLRTIHGVGRRQPWTTLQQRTSAQPLDGETGQPYKYPQIIFSDTCAYLNSLKGMRQSRPWSSPSRPKLASDQRTLED